jgi:hypothetical protein
VEAGQLTSGRDYYVRLRVKNQHSDDQIRGLWSKPVKFSVAPGVPVRAPYSGVVLTAPNFGATSVPLRPGFTWGTIPGATEYELVLAKDASFSQVVAGTPVKVKSTAWQSPSELDYGTTYFWRVRAIAPVASDWGTGVFTTESAPVPPPQPQLSPPPSTTPPAAQATPSYLLWMVIGIILVIALLVVIVRTGR